MRGSLTPPLNLKTAPYHVINKKESCQGLELCARTDRTWMLRLWRLTICWRVVLLSGPFFWWWHSLTAGLVCYCCSQLAVVWRLHAAVRTGVWHALWSFFVVPCLCMKSGVSHWECISSCASKGHGPQNIDSNRLSTVLCNNQFDFWCVCVSTCVCVCVCESVWTEAISSFYQRQERGSERPRVYTAFVIVAAVLSKDKE